MDERRLADLFRETADAAAHNGPPATFDHTDVLAGSERARRLHRRRLTGAVAAAVVVVAAAGVVSATALSTGGGPGTLAEPAQATPNDRVPEVGGGTTDVRSAQPGPDEAGTAPFDAGPAPPSAAAPGPVPQRAVPFEKRDASSSCAIPDTELFAQLGNVLPAVRGASPRPLSDQVSCPSKGRGFEVDVDDRGARGVMRVLVSPSRGGMTVTSHVGGSVVTTTRSTPSGGSLSISIVSDGRAPFANQLDEIARALADQH